MPHPRPLPLLATCALALTSPLVHAQQPTSPQPGFHQALRWSQDSARTTYRMRVPVRRAGERVRVSFRAGTGALRLYAATVALSGPSGSLASEPVALTFSGASTFSAAAGQRVTSDAVALAVPFGAELAVSFEVEGALAASALQNFPGSYARAGSYTSLRTALGGSAFTKMVGLDTVEVEGATTRAFVAIGDSITEAYVTDPGDARDGWPAVAELALKVPLVNAAVYGQGVSEASAKLDAEVLTLRGVTDCAVLLGTNDLGTLTAAQLETKLAALYDRLRPFCRVWGATLPPKERSGNSAPLADVNAQRRAVNEWLRTLAQVQGVLDFDAVLRDPASPDRFLAGLGQDGIHPSVAGQRKMGEEAARALAEAEPTPVPAAPLALSALAPTTGPTGGGTAVTLTGSGFASGVQVRFGEALAESVQVQDAEHLRATAPAHAAGSVEVVATSASGQVARAQAPFVYAEGPRPVTPEAPEALQGDEGSGSSCAVAGGVGGLAPLLALGVLGLLRRSRR
ncbi:SGNH/GDSL hydrolase family protein [Aggregicoccus sp. 17bor-14]|uniref:GDSL-type esterase/lipase family protein n=1 Tax=Myxococcaceae TaxID=31 RepID=UPI00129C656E|nr:MULTISPECIES: GDSL-type esterase/lipase family protein [Myxococcaceae]MBF5043215.1 IPT/TIG domain-containing protein [Simulacricoccus sp. 17bor-14]MRI88972.1 SGNH/GDSL hydrolase family protein [Aggregicoccus sp. 17bor-14]